MRSVFTFFMLFSLLWLTQSSLAQDNYRRGDVFFESKRYAMAVKEYENALSRRPLDMYALTKAARCHVYLGNLKQANTYLTRIESKSPFLTAEFLRTKAEYLHYSYDFHEAISYYKKSDPTGRAFVDTEKRIHECEVGKKLCKRPKNVKIQNMGPRVNSPDHDVLPKITADFGLMYFTSQREGSVGGTKNPEDVYLTAYTGDSWISPIHLPQPLNTDLNEACVGLSQDGQTMFLFRGSNNGDLFISSLKGAEWQEPIAFRHNSEHRESSMCISPDGKKLYFVRQVIGRESNIYQCELMVNGEWSEPKLIPGKINSEYDEASPYLHPDGVTMYFSSKGHDSMGGYDIFKSTLSNGEWSLPMNMGAPINTPGDDMNFVLSASGKFGFYSSLRQEGYGGQDLYVVALPKGEHQASLTLLKGMVIEKGSNKPLEAEIRVIDNTSGKEVAVFTSNSETGRYLVALPAGKDYGIRIEKKDHGFYSKNIRLEKGQNFKEVENNVELNRTKEGTIITLRNIFFASGKHNLDARSHPELDHLAEVMSSNTSMVIEVVGHTDDVGKQEDNLLLSQKRAQEVVTYLASKGIKIERLKFKGSGSAKPLVSNDTKEGRSQNRRTEIVIIKE